MKLNNLRSFSAKAQRVISKYYSTDLVLIWYEIANNESVTHKKSVSSVEEAQNFMKETIEAEGGDLFKKDVAEKAYRLAKKADKDDEAAQEAYLRLADKEAIKGFSDNAQRVISES